MNKRLAAVAVLLLGLTVGLALLHGASRPEIPEGSVLVQTSGGDFHLILDKLPAVPITGEIVNGRGERKPVSGEGIALKDALLAAGVSVPRQVTAIAEDEYSAVVEGNELDEERIYLLIEGNEGRLVAFGDPDSRRSVSHLVRLVVE